MAKLRFTADQISSKMSKLFSSKFVRLLKTLREEEIKGFELWLRSPWCNTNKNLSKLLQQLKKYYPTFDDHRLSKEKLFQQVLPKGKFSDRRVNNLLSEGFLAAERFLVFQGFAQNQNLQTALLIEEFQKHYLEDWFFKTAKLEIDRLEAQPMKSWEEHLNLFNYYRRLYHHTRQEPRLALGRSPILGMEEQLDLLYLLEKAAIINEKILRKRVLKNERYELATEIKKWELIAEGLEHPAIDLYRMRFAYQPDNLLDQYWKLRKELLDQITQLNEKEQKTHLLSLINDSILLVRSGHLDIIECLPLYQLGLKIEALLHQGKLSRNSYTMIVILSNTKGTFDYTQYFIENYTRVLEVKIRDDCYYWARAHTAYWKKELEACLDILQEHVFKAPYFQLISRVLNTQVYFDLYLKDDSYQFFLFSFFDAFEKWLNREKLWSKTNKVAFLRFVQKSRMLARYYETIDFPISKVEKLLENEQNIQALNWLNQKKEEVLRIRSN